MMNDEVRSDHSMLQRFRRGQNGVAPLLFLRYAKRVRGAGVRPILARVGGPARPRRHRPVGLPDLLPAKCTGQYDVPEGEEIWKLLLVIALHKIRDAGDYHRAARRDVGRRPGVPPTNRRSTRRKARTKGRSPSSASSSMRSSTTCPGPPGDRRTSDRRLRGRRDRRGVAAVEAYGRARCSRNSASGSAQIREDD